MIIPLGFPSQMIWWLPLNDSVWWLLHRIFQNISSHPSFPCLHTKSDWLPFRGDINKHKFFGWLLLWDRLNTRNLLRRKKMILDNYSCVLCSQNTEETLYHLFFLCPFSIACWGPINIVWNTNLAPEDMIKEAYLSSNKRFFREVMILACWCIWTHRSSIIFYHQTSSIIRWLQCFKDDVRKTLPRL
jgi:hypothetical protein